MAILLPHTPAADKDDARLFIVMQQPPGARAQFEQAEFRWFTLVPAILADTQELAVLTTSE